MGLLADRDLRLAEQIAALAYANPFLEERIAHEQAILGDSYVASQEYWSLLPDLERKANIDLIAARSAELVESLTERREGGVRLADNEVRLHDDVVIYFLYDRYREALFDLVDADTPSRVSFYPRFAADVSRYLSDRIDAGHLFACFYQVRRAFHHIFRFIIGRSPAAARLRGRIWESIFTHDMRRYRRSLYLKMADVPTLVTGPTGTGKELVARAIGLSRYIPFDASRERFARTPSSTFVGLNLSALSPTLIESELFGHRKGAFTGAIADREGYLESCGPFGTVFLDEIGEVDPAVQVKLLRVIQSRTFNRLGDTAPRSFGGKLIAATNRNLNAEKQGYGTKVVEVKLSESPSDIEVKLAPNAGVAIRILDARDGRLLSSFMRVFDAQNRVVYESPMRFGGFGSPEEIRIGLDPGTYRAVVTAGGYASRNVTITSPGSHNIGLTPGGSILVRSKGSEIRRARLMGADGREYLRNVFNPIFTIDPSPGVTQLDNVAPGSYTLQILGPSNEVLGSEQVVVQEGQRSVVEI